MSLLHSFEALFRIIGIFAVEKGISVPNFHAQQSLHPLKGNEGMRMNSVGLKACPSEPWSLYHEYACHSIPSAPFTRYLK